MTDSLSIAANTMLLRPPKPVAEQVFLLLRLRLILSIKETLHFRRLRQHEHAIHLETELGPGFFLPLPPPLTFFLAALLALLAASSLICLIFIPASTMYHTASLRIDASSAVPAETVMTSANRDIRLSSRQASQYSQIAKNPAAKETKYTAQ